MGDKRLMDNKVVKNPLLTGVNQTSFIQDFVQSSLLVPAAPPKLLQATAEASNSGQEKSLNKPPVSGGNKSETAVLPAVSYLSSALSLGGPSENNQQIAPPVVLLPPNQYSSISSTIIASSLSEVPLEGSISSASIIKPTSSENISINPPPKLAGPPPLTSYNRPSNKLSSSRYPSSSFLQTVPSAQFFSQSNPNTPSVSPSNSLQNFPKSSSTSPITYFLPQQQTAQQPIPDCTSSVAAPLLTQTAQFCPPVQKDFQSITFSTKSNDNVSLTTNTKTVFSGQGNLTQPPLADHLSQSPSLLQPTHPTVLTPIKVSTPTPLPVSTNTNLASVNLSASSTSVPSLPVSQPIILPTTPTLLPTSAVGIAPIPPTTASVPLVSDTNSHIHLVNSSDYISQSSSVSSSLLCRTSSSGQPISPPELASKFSSPSLSSAVFSPAVVEVSSSQSSTSLISNSAYVSTSSSGNISEASKPQTSSPAPSAVSALTSHNQQSSVSSINSISLSLGQAGSSSVPRTLSTQVSQVSLPTSHSGAFPESNTFKPVPSTVCNFASITSSISTSVSSLTPTTSGSPSLTVLNQPLTSPPHSSLITSSITQSSEALATTHFQPITSAASLSDETLSYNKDSQPEPSLEVITSLNSTVTSSEKQILSDSSSASSGVATIPVSNFVSSNTALPIGHPSSEQESPSQLHSASSENLSVKVPVSNISFESNLPASTTPRGASFQPHSDNQDSLTKTSLTNCTVSRDPQVEPVTSISSASNQTSVSLSEPQPTLFTFSTPSCSTSFTDSLSHPPHQPYNKSAPSVLGHLIQPLAHPKSSSPNSVPSEPCAPLFSEKLAVYPSNNSPFLPKQDINTSLPLITPPLLDPSKFFSTSPPQASKFINNSTSSQVVPDPLQPISSTFTPFPQRKFTIPPATVLPTSPEPPPHNLINLNKESALSQNLSTLKSSIPPTFLPSHTPPPPYSSLSFVHKTVEFQTHNTEPTASTLSQPDGNVVQPQKTDVKDEELDQIPLDGNTVPLYNPLSVGALSNHSSIPPTKSGISNTFRLGSGLKRPSYAAVPDLGITHQVSQVFPTMSSPPPFQMNTTSSVPVTTPSTTPSSSVASSPPPESASFNYSVTAQGQIYRPPYHHWFYKKGDETKAIWQPFSMADSLNLEQVFTSPDLNEHTKVPTDGGRYDVEVVHRRKVSVYWEESPGEVRRCSWFVRAPIESRYIPYDENIAEILEDAYKTGCLRNEWNRRVELADGEVIILHSPNAMAHHQRSSSPDAWGNPPTMQQKPRIVKRGLEDFEISEGEPNQIDHLLLMVHGIGKVCDLRFRSLVQVVDDFRSVSLQLVQSHFRSGIENGNVGRVEILPVEWHRALHTETIDKRLSDITLPSIPKAREFTNDVLLDILFYTSPVFCERIVQAVGAEINRVFNLYMSRNPGFRGGVSLGGHSLGSLILFDMLCHQKPQRSMKSAFSPQSSIHEGDEDMPEVGCLKAKARLSRRMSYLTIGSAGTGQPYIVYPQLHFQPKAFFALGSPIGMFLTVRGIEGLGEEFKFPTCPKFFNIFHPNDPVAYRIEALVSPQMVGIPAVVIPHHKGRKRMHLELKDTMTHVTAALKQKLIDSMRSTWNTVYQLAMFHRPDSSIQQEVDNVIENEILSNNDCDQVNSNQLMITDQEALNVKVGNLNGGNRIDYVLQEAPLETFNQYISAVRSHVVYWESLDTMLLILKELYATIGISPDSQVPQPILPFDISADAGNETYSEYTDSIGAPPTQFIRK